MRDHGSFARALFRTPSECTASPASRSNSRKPWPATDPDMSHDKAAVRRDSHGTASSLASSLPSSLASPSPSSSCSSSFRVSSPKSTPVSLPTTDKLASSQQLPLLHSTSSMRQRIGQLRKHFRTKLDLQAMALSFCRSFYEGLSMGRVLVFLVTLSIITYCLLTLPVAEKLKAFLVWLKGVGPFWGPFILALAYIPLTVLALPGSILTLGGGYVFGLVPGFVADSIGSTLGATVAFLVGKTLCRAYVSAKLKEYPQFQIISHATSKNGFKIVLLLRLVPILPFNILNYVLSVTPISVPTYMLASWIGMMPMTFAFVYMGTTLKDISEIGSPEALSARNWWLVILGLMLTVVSTVLMTRIAKDALEKAIEEQEGPHEELGFRLSGSPGGRTSPTRRSPRTSTSQLSPGKFTELEAQEGQAPPGPGGS